MCAGSGFLKTKGTGEYEDPELNKTHVKTITVINHNRSRNAKVRKPRLRKLPRVLPGARTRRAFRVAGDERKPGDNEA